MIWTLYSNMLIWVLQSRSRNSLIETYMSITYYNLYLRKKTQRYFWAWHMYIGWNIWLYLILHSLLMGKYCYPFLNPNPASALIIIIDVLEVLFHTNSKGKSSKRYVKWYWQNIQIWKKFESAKVPMIMTITYFRSTIQDILV